MNIDVNNCTQLVWVKTSFVGFHCWPEAPREVAYLRNLHRHVFGVVVKVLVGHDDRDIEFHMLKAKVDVIIRDDLRVNLKNSPGMSCEMIAKHIASCLVMQGIDVASVHVDEDGECGADVHFILTQA